MELQQKPVAEAQAGQAWEVHRDQVAVAVRWAHGAGKTSRARPGVRGTTHCSRSGD